MFHVEQTNALTLLSEYAKSIQFPLSSEQIDSFKTYLEHLQAWNKLINLTTISDSEDIVFKHFIDSLAMLQLEDLRFGASLLDVGSGAGFPGIPLKIARPDLSTTLLEPSPKKSSFLHFIVGRLKIGHMEVCTETVERFAARASFDSYDYITTRALRFDFVLGHCAGILKRGGKILLYTSQPLDRMQVGSQWVINKSHSFELPYRKGRRALSVLSLVS